MTTTRTHRKRTERMARPRRRTGGAAALFLVLTAATAQAQVSTIPSGARARLLESAARFPSVGTISGMARDTLFFNPESNPNRRIAYALANINRLELSQGRKTALLPGMVAGLVTFGLGALIYNRIESFSCETTASHCDTGLSPAPLAVIGGGSGGLIGSFFTIERWQRVTLPQNRTVPR